MALGTAVPTATSPTDSARRRLGTSLAQQESNTNYATRQANQLGQPGLVDFAAPPLIPDAGDSGAKTPYSLDPNDPNSQPPRLISDAEYAAQTAAATGGTAPVYSPTQQGLSPVVAQYPTTVTPAGATSPATATGSGSTAQDLALKIVQEMYGFAKPDSTGSKEIAKESLLAQQRQAIEQIQQSAASRGLSGGWEQGTIAEIMSQLGPNLTAAYRGIDLQDDDTYFQRLLGSMDGARTLAGIDLDREGLALQGELGRGGLALQGELGRGNLALGQQRLGIEHEDMQLRRALAEKQAQEAFLQALFGLL
jgi:hypothetical protein